MLHRKTKTKDGVAYYAVDGSTFEREYAIVKGQIFKSENGWTWIKSGGGAWKKGSSDNLKELDRKMKAGESEISPDSDLWT